MALTLSNPNNHIAGGDHVFIFSPNVIYGTGLENVDRGLTYAHIWAPNIGGPYPYTSAFNIPLQIPAQLYGAPLYLKSLKISYRVAPSSASAITQTRLYTTYDDLTVAVPLSEAVTHNSHSASTYTLSLPSPFLFYGGLQVTLFTSFAGPTSTNGIDIGNITLTTTSAL